MLSSRPLERRSFDLVSRLSPVLGQRQSFWSDCSNSFGRALSETRSAIFVSVFVHSRYDWCDHLARAKSRQNKPHPARIGAHRHWEREWLPLQEKPSGRR